jgi:hypothetical protein
MSRSAPMATANDSNCSGYYEPERQQDRWLQIGRNGPFFVAHLPNIHILGCKIVKSLLTAGANFRFDASYGPGS